MKYRITLFVFFSFVIPCNSQSISDILKNSFIWNSSNSSSRPAYTVFRKTFNVEDVKKANISIFADTRYILWINGVEVLKGPCRFDPSAPQYDQSDILNNLKRGKNSIAVLVLSHASNGKMMEHSPGLTACIKLEKDSVTSYLCTDTTWKCNNRTRYLPPYISWGFLCDRVDARLDDGDWFDTNYNDTHWNNAICIDGNKWGKLVARGVPLLTRIDVPVNAITGISFPLTIDAGKSIIMEVARMIQGTVDFDFETTFGNSIIVEVGYSTDSTNITTYYKTHNIYIAKAGRQHYETTESYGLQFVKITVLNSPIKLYSVKAYDRRYPFFESGKFVCSDAFLNELFERASNTIKLNAEDTYMDCALREKAEWMGDGAVVEYPISRVLYGRRMDDGLIKSDPRLMKNMLKHIAQSQSNDGMMKAHHPSDRFDVHAYIEDYSCLWVQSLRLVFDNTNDTALVRELWKPLEKQMEWFRKRVTENGLLKAREFVFFDNPIAYLTCEGATLNAFYYKALVDASYLSTVLNNFECANKFSKEAHRIFDSFNKYLWLNDRETYLSGILDNREIVPTAHSSLIALQMGIVPENRKDKVKKFLFENYNNDPVKIIKRDRDWNVHVMDSAFYLSNKVGGIDTPYTAFWLLNEFFSSGLDSLALNYIRNKWEPMMNIPQIQTLREMFNKGDLCHNAGAVPAYHLLSFVLGVKSISFENHIIEIKPQLGDLQFANGSVVTENGVVEVVWKKSNEGLAFRLKIPKNTTAVVRLPQKGYKGEIKVNDRKINAICESGFYRFELNGGFYIGLLK